MTATPGLVDWVLPAQLTSVPVMTTFGGVSVWAATTQFPLWDGPVYGRHELDCRKGLSLVADVDDDMSCAEIEMVRRFREAGWSGGWLATCGRQNPRWLPYMVDTAARPSRAGPQPALLPARVASLLVRHGPSGYPDVVVWKPPQPTRFLELKGPRDRGTAQARWVAAAVNAGTIALEDFLLVSWSGAGDPRPGAASLELR